MQQSNEYAKEIEELMLEKEKDDGKVVKVKKIKSIKGKSVL